MSELSMLLVNNELILKGKSFAVDFHKNQLHCQDPLSKDIICDQSDKTFDCWERKEANIGSDPLKYKTPSTHNLSIGAGIVVKISERNGLDLLLRWFRMISSSDLRTRSYYFSPANFHLVGFLLNCHIEDLLKFLTVLFSDKSIIYVSVGWLSYNLFHPWIVSLERGIYFGNSSG